MGRAPTSGNCHTCRKRRVKCDQARPACERCVRGGFVCQGYETVLRIQNHAVVAGVAPGSVRLAKVQDMTSFPRKEKEVAAPPTPRRASKRAAATPAQPTTAAKQTPSPSPPSMPQELSLVGFVDDMAFSYFFQAYGWINMHSILLQDSAMRGHLLASDSTVHSRDASSSSSSSSFSTPPSSSLSSAHVAGDMAQDSLRALCYGLLGRDKHVPALQDAARRAYGKAIADLRAAIATPTTETADLALLVKPIALLGAYSVAIERDRRFTHHAGLARILEICGPAAFQSPTLLPVFESARMTLVADAVVRRQESTFLDSVEWKTVPWARNPAAKSPTNRLLDVLSAVPALIHGAWAVFNDRVAWLAAGGPNELPRIESPDAVPSLLARVRQLRSKAAAWHRWWTEDASPTECLARRRVLTWAYAHTGDDSYRPGIMGVQGPDHFETSLYSVLQAWHDDTAFSTVSLRDLEDDPRLPTHMQDAALYTTALVWADRLDRYLGHAARSPTCTDFFSKPFRSPCPCRSTMTPTVCQTVPPRIDTARASQAVAWNAATCTMAGGPVRCVNAVRPEMEWPATASPTASPLRSGPGPSESHATFDPITTVDPAELTKGASLASDHGGLVGDLLLPGDIRFVAHMRILSYLCARLPATRGPVLATLAAVGLAHCSHDVRPSEGHADIAAVAVARVFEGTGVDGAADILLRQYTPATATVAG
ncbi:hypothetical protein HMPREF1624_05279 [Sporothrix schenckii ATCC 58251]|uniref:Zn(2)-C6 fungal-type domain-containing protein n=1 Tax=Sporothrix schenckii (strain ATCC 58251 / de Perez 2211183) TaxID=1391915 RepID=U7PVL4_SPOS1|nr:hypothetical protein HMPREF1624_05279 [Sporothrix schenckii ATCC 58251]